MSAPNVCGPSAVSTNCKREISPPEGVGLFWRCADHWPAGPGFRAAEAVKNFPRSALRWPADSHAAFPRWRFPCCRLGGEQLRLSRFIRHSCQPRSNLRFAKMRSNEMVPKTAIWPSPFRELPTLHVGGCTMWPMVVVYHVNPLVPGNVVGENGLIHAGPYFAW